MLKVSDIISELGMSKAQFLELLNQCTGKVYSMKTTKISEKTLLLVKKAFFSEDKNIETKQFIKLNEIEGDDTGFLSKLGFEDEDEKDEEEDDALNSNLWERKEITITQNTLINQIKSAEITEIKIHSLNQIITKKIFPTKNIETTPVVPITPKTEPKKEITPPKITNKNLSNQTSTQSPSKNTSSEKIKPFIVIKKTQSNTTIHTTQNKQINKILISQDQNSLITKKGDATQTSSTLIQKKQTIIGDMITVKEFAEKIGISLSEVMKKMLQNKIILGANASLDFDTASLIGEELNVKVIKKSENLAIEDIISGSLEKILEQDKLTDTLKPRPPIVTVMGHVDHGKTKLLDYLRKTNIVAGEAGGITQSIGASQILYKDKKITFIDTPGHELFTSLRARGAKITDIVIIVIAGDDGIKQQTIEAINHAKEAHVPIIVAITKIDKPNIDLEMIRGQLAEHELICEERGGQTVCIGVSAITGAGINDLLDIILLQTEILNLQYNYARSGIGVVLEANKDQKKGVITNLICMTGKMRLGDLIFIHNTFGRIRKIYNWKGDAVLEVFGGDPAMILGLQDIPEPGRLTEILISEKEMHLKLNLIKQKESNNDKSTNLQNLFDKISKGELVQLKLILKADSYGSLEALKYAISKVNLPENIEIKKIHTAVGEVSGSDIILANASQAMIVCFNLNLTKDIYKKSEELNVKIKNFDIIYELVSYIEMLVQGLIKIEEKEVFLGKMEVLGVFYRKAKEMIIGGKVLEGKIENGVLFKLHRYNQEINKLEEIGKGKVISLKKETENVKEIGQGHECGLKVRVDTKINEKDILEFFKME